MVLCFSQIVRCEDMPDYNPADPNFNKYHCIRFSCGFPIGDGKCSPGPCRCLFLPFQKRILWPKKLIFGQKYSFLPWKNMGIGFRISMGIGVEFEYPLNSWKPTNPLYIRHEFLHNHFFVFFSLLLSRQILDLHGLRKAWKRRELLWHRNCEFWPAVWPICAMQSQIRLHQKLRRQNKRMSAVQRHAGLQEVAAWKK